MAGGVAIEIRVADKTQFDLFALAFEEEMMGAMAFANELVIGTAMEKAPVYRGMFRQSIDADIRSDREELTIIAEVFTTSSYAPIIEGVDEEGNEVEFGRRPGTAFPNIGELRLWVERVIQPPEEELDDVTLAVGRKIVSRGILPKRPIGNAFRQHEAKIKRELERGLDRALNRI